MTTQTILLVDDQPELIDPTLALLRDHYTIRVAIDGARALRAVARGGVDLILLDVMMPVTDGYEVCRQLKNDPATAQIPIIFLTAQQDATDEAKGFALGAADYIHKPPHPDLLRARISNQLELKRHRDHLETLVRERTQALEQANQQLTAANQAKADFLTVISHEMRTPLNSVIGFSDCLLADPSVTPEHQSLLRFIHDAGVHLLANINDIIDFVRLDPLTFTLEQMAFNLAQHLQDVVRGMRKEADQKGLTLRIEVDESANQHVVGDPRRLGQVLRHLLSNGIKFTQQGGVTVHLSAVPLPDPEKMHFLITVQDTGCGIPYDKLSFIFQQFTQTENPYTRKQGGFGMGLAICQKLVTLMTGQLQVVHSDPSGTLISFAVDLRLADCRPIGMASSAPEPLAVPTTASSTDKPLDRAAVAERLTEIARGLHSGNLRVLEHLEPLRLLLAGSSLVTEFSQLEQALEAYAFDVASQHLTTLTRRLQES
ncbi:MAG: response regulator [Magnetococcales bacterium]|nr:response regulator [Magnetococcales bacterium]